MQQPDLLSHKNTVWYALHNDIFFKYTVEFLKSL